MSAPTKALPGRRARRCVRYAGPRPDPVLLLWPFMALEGGCASATSLLGAWALLPAGLLVVALVAGAVWSTRDWSA